MYQDRVVLCASSAYTKKFWFNEDFKTLPEPIQQELKIICVLFTEDVGGVLSLEYEEDGTLVLKEEEMKGIISMMKLVVFLKNKGNTKDESRVIGILELYYKVFFPDGNA